MTREELKENICGMTHEDMFEYIYELESRTCESCKYCMSYEQEEDCSTEYYCDMEVSEETSLGRDLITEFFGCNKWEAKDK